MRLFGRKGHQGGNAAVLSQMTEPSTGPAGPPEDKARDTLAQMLRVFGRESFRLDEEDGPPLADRCEHWARHVLTGAPAGPQTDEDLVGERDWPGLKRFFTLRRCNEAGFVERWRSESKKMIWDLVTAMRSLAGAGQEAQETVATTLERLETAARQESLSELREAVGSALETIRAAMQEQRAQLDAELAAMGRRLATLREELVEARREMAIDPLTQVFNRRAFDDALSQNVTLSTLSGQPLALLMVDIDHFKAVNDTRGHTVGDVVLRELASRIVRVFPRRRDFVARYGGEEFAVILPDADAETAPMLAARLLQAVRERSFVDNPPLWLTCSVGYALLAKDEEPLTLLERADRALYQAKHEGRDRAVGPEDAVAA